jgi:hypothetical protein
MDSITATSDTSPLDSRRGKFSRHKAKSISKPVENQRGKNMMIFGKIKHTFTFAS